MVNQWKYNFDSLRVSQNSKYLSSRYPSSIYRDLTVLELSMLGHRSFTSVLTLRFAICFQWTGSCLTSLSNMRSLLSWILNCLSSPTNMKSLSSMRSLSWFLKSLSRILRSLSWGLRNIIRPFTTTTFNLCVNRNLMTTWHPFPMTTWHICEIKSDWNKKSDYYLTSVLDDYLKPMWNKIWWHLMSVPDDYMKPVWNKIEWLPDVRSRWLPETYVK